MSVGFPQMVSGGTQQQLHHYNHAGQSATLDAVLRVREVRCTTHEVEQNVTCESSRRHSARGAELERNGSIARRLRRFSQ